MARIIGGIGSSHSPTIGFAYDKNKQEDLKQNIAKLAVTDADEVIAKEVLRASKVLLNDGE